MGEEGCMGVGGLREENGIGMNSGVRNKERGNPIGQDTFVC